MTMNPEPDFDALELGHHSEVIDISTRDETRRAAAALAGQSRQTLEIFSRDLEPAIYDQKDFLDAVTRLALGSSRARIRILITDPGRLVRGRHRLLELSRRLSSYVEMRVPSEEHARYSSALLLADSTGVLWRTLGSRYEGTVCFHAPAQARDLLKSFHDMWQVAVPDVNLKGLRI